MSANRVLSGISRLRCRIVSLDLGRLVMNAQRCIGPSRGYSQQTPFPQPAADPCSTSQPCRSCDGPRRAGRRFLLGTSGYRLIGGHRSICQTAQRLAGQHLLTIGRTRKFFALLYFRLFNGCGAKRTRSHKVGIKPKWFAAPRSPALAVVSLEDRR